MEDVLPPQTQEGSGFELTRVRQFTVFLENRVGRLSALVRTLEQACKIAAISIEESADAALVRLICCDPDCGKLALREAGFSFSESMVLAVELPARSDRPLLALCTAILTAEINIHYAYPLLDRPNGAAIALYVEDPTLAARILVRKGFAILSEGDMRML